MSCLLFGGLTTWEVYGLKKSFFSFFCHLVGKSCFLLFFLYFYLSLFNLATWSAYVNISSISTSLTCFNFNIFANICKSGQKCRQSDNNSAELFSDDETFLNILLFSSGSPLQAGWAWHGRSLSLWRNLSEVCISLLGMSPETAPYHRASEYLYSYLCFVLWEDHIFMTIKRITGSVTISSRLNHIWQKCNHFKQRHHHHR